MKVLAAVSESGFNLASPVVGTSFEGLPQIRIQGAVWFAIGILLVVGAVGFFLNLLFGAVQWVFSGGEKEALEKARKRITNSLIGLLILFSAYALATLIDTIFLGGNGGIFHLLIPSLFNQ